VSRQGTVFNAAMGQFQQEVVRWNRQINLVSRKGTLARVADLIGQCRDAWMELNSAEFASWDAADSVWYFDLGSGGGLPGYVWHQLLSARFDNLKTWLVEPREKRAWFLERLNKITPERPLQVWNARWCETPSVGGLGSSGMAPADLVPARVLISMKALRLSDPVVLTGLEVALGEAALPAGGVVAIARFYPLDQKWTSGLAEELEITKGALVVGGVTYQPVKQEVVSPKSKHPMAASLVLSTYEVSA
jgi:16S rRNA G527 N7-methylase RsmG